MAGLRAVAAAPATTYPHHVVVRIFDDKIKSQDRDNSVNTLPAIEIVRLVIPAIILQVVVVITSIVEIHSRPSAEDVITVPTVQQVITIPTA